MKKAQKTRLALAAVAALASLSPLAARAQSSVTLYGTVDAALMFVNSEHAVGADGSIHNRSNTSIVSDGLSPSSFGLKGSEDLGGGLSATFHLEEGFNIATGAQDQSGAMFNRLATVGLSSEKYGALTIGRQYDPYSDFVGAFSASNAWAGQFASHYGDIDNLNQAFNLSNAIKYVSPTYAGFTIGGAYAFGGVAGDYSANRAWSLAASYENGPVSAGVGYLNVRDPFGSTLGGVSGPGGARGFQGDSGYFGALDCGGVLSTCSLQNAKSLQTWGAGASYTVGQVKLGAVYTRTLLSQSLFFDTPSGASFDNYELNAAWTPISALTLGAAYTFTDGHAAGAGPRFHQVNLGANYSLSKRTTLYAIAVAQSAEGTAPNPDGGAGGENRAQIPYLPGTSSDKQVAVGAGLHVSF
jgi:predicted porin